MYIGSSVGYYKTMENKLNYFKVQLINHTVDERATLVLLANHEVHAARKAEKKMGYGWEALTIN